MRSGIRHPSDQATVAGTHAVLARRHQLTPMPVPNLLWQVKGKSTLAGLFASTLTVTGASTFEGAVGMESTLQASRGSCCWKECPG